VRNVLAKRQKVEEGRQHRKIAAEDRKAKSKTNVVVTGKRERERENFICHNMNRNTMQHN